MQMCIIIEVGSRVIGTSSNVNRTPSASAGVRYGGAADIRMKYPTVFRTLLPWLTPQKTAKEKDTPLAQMYDTPEIGTCTRIHRNGPVSQFTDS